MHVIATAGHVDHGKSTLVRALTGMEPDRWAEERRRGMTIDLGFAWTTLPSGRVLGFVDVPGHQRFIGNMLAGLGPAPAVLVVVAADEGWRQQSQDHLAAVDALGLRHGLLAVTRSDLAAPGPALDQARRHLARSSLGEVEAVAVSGRTGAGTGALRDALDRLVAGLPRPDTGSRVRLWVDRAFTIHGSGTVVTGTLGAGTLRVGDDVELNGRVVKIRGLQSLGEAHDEVCAVARVAVNLRNVDRGDVHRGDALLTVGAWRPTPTMDVRLSVAARTLPSELILHVGSRAVPAHVRPLAGDVARLVLRAPAPVVAGDRALLRDPGRRVLVAGVLVLDADPPQLRRRGEATARAAALADADGRLRLVDEVRRRGVVRVRDLVTLGVLPHDARGDVLEVGEWLIAPERWSRWQTDLRLVVDAHAVAAPLERGVTQQAARRALNLPDPGLLDELARAAGLESVGGRVRRPPSSSSLGPVEQSVRSLERHLAANPFAAPEKPDLDAWGLDARALAAAAATGRLLRLRDDVVLAPDGPASAIRILAELPQPFTASQARQALGTTRRVAIPLLEHLDSLRWTRRLDGALREVRGNR